MNWNGDGIGDFPALAQRLDHLADLGVTCPPSRGPCR
jgi:glycosidase